MLVENCKNEANITTESTNEDNVAIGGIIGAKWSSNNLYFTINNCENKGKITGKASGELWSGGIIGCGYNNTDIINCNNTGTLEGTTTDKNGGSLGGIVGYSPSPSKILNCYNQGNISITKGNVGGIIGNGGWHQAYLVNCYNAGKLTGGTQGGLAGSFNISNDLLVTKNCYFINTEVSKAIGRESGINGANEEGIVGCTEEELKSSDVLSKFNEIEESEDYDVSQFKKWEKGEDGYPAFIRNEK